MEPYLDYYCVVNMRELAIKSLITRQYKNDVTLSSDLLWISSRNKNKLDEKVQRSNPIQGHEDAQWFE